MFLCFPFLKFSPQILRNSDNGGEDGIKRLNLGNNKIGNKGKWMENLEFEGIWKIAKIEQEQVAIIILSLLFCRFFEIMSPLIPFLLDFL